MTARGVAGITMSSLGVAGIIYSAVGIFDYQIYRNPLVGIVVVAMILLVGGLILMKSTLTEGVEEA